MAETYGRQHYDGERMAEFRRAVAQGESTAWSLDREAMREFLAALQEMAPDYDWRIGMIDVSQIGIDIELAKLLLVTCDVLHQSRGESASGASGASSTPTPTATTVIEREAWNAVRAQAAGGHSSTTEDTLAFEQLLEVLARRAGVLLDEDEDLINILGLGDGDSVMNSGDPFVGLGARGAEVLLKMWDYVRELPTANPRLAPDPALTARMNSVRGLPGHTAKSAVWDRETTYLLLEDTKVRTALCGQDSPDNLAVMRAFRERIVKVVEGGAWSPGEYSALVNGFDVIHNPLSLAERGELARIEAELARLTARKSELTAKTQQAKTQQAKTQQAKTRRA